jgi:transposase-like protein
MNEPSEETITSVEKKPVKRFTETDKKEAVNELKNSTVKVVAEKYGCSANSLAIWKKKYSSKTVSTKEKKEQNQPIEKVKKNVEFREIILEQALKNPQIKNMLIDYLLEQLK